MFADAGKGCSQMSSRGRGGGVTLFRRLGARLLVVAAVVVTVIPLQHLASAVKLELDEPTVDWEKAPRLDLVCRTYGRAMDTFWRTFLPTYLLFWPISSWTSSNVLVVMDAENPVDHMFGTMLQNMHLPRQIQVKYETPAPNNTLCNSWRREGYARMQYSNFYAELSTDADYVGFIDTDSEFISHVVPNDLFDGDKPRVRAFNIKTKWDSEVTKKAVGGFESVGKFMNAFVFPFIVKSPHFIEMREHIAANLGVATFDEAFKVMCSEGENSYSQFEIMANYLWYHKRDEYSWHIADPDDADLHTKGEERATNHDSVRAANIPVIFVMRHAKIESSLDESTYKSLCLGSNYEAGDCRISTTPEDLVGEAQTRMWSVGDITWQDTWQDHARRVSLARSAFNWQGEKDEDTFSVGNQSLPPR